jgi:hypothetical protein
MTGARATWPFDEAVFVDRLADAGAPELGRDRPVLCFGDGRRPS